MGTVSDASKGQPEPEHLPCPRCSSTNTKFCYYNNYNFSQPRHFCKACRRYWTHGGTLRDIPVGGGSRKGAKRSRAAHHHFRRAPQAPVAPLAGGSFISLLNTTTTLPHGTGILALGGFGLDDVGFGLGRAVWPFYGGDGSGPASWHVENRDAGSFLGGEYLPFPDIAGTLLK